MKVLPHRHRQAAGVEVEDPDEIDDSDGRGRPRPKVVSQSVLLLTEGALLLPPACEATALPSSQLSAAPLCCM